MIKVDVKGLAGVEAALQELVEATSSRTGKAALTRGLIKAAEPMVQRAKALAPVDDGELRGSIVAGARSPVAQAGRQAYAVAIKGGADQATAVAALKGAQRSARATAPAVTIAVGQRGKPASRAHLTEFGSAPHTIKPRRKTKLAFAGPGGRRIAVDQVSHPGARPRPFMRPAFEATKGQVVDGVADEIRTEITKASARARAKAGKV